MFAVICLNRRRVLVEFSLEQGHWSAPREGSVVVPREVNTCFLGHFTARVETDIIDVSAQLSEKLVNSRVKRLCARQSQICVFSVSLGTSSPGRVMFCVSGPGLSCSSKTETIQPVLLCWALWKPSLGSPDDGSDVWHSSGGINILGSGWFPAELVFVQDTTLGSLRSALLGVTLMSHSIHYCSEKLLGLGILGETQQVYCLILLLHEEALKDISNFQTRPKTH